MMLFANGEDSGYVYAVRCLIMMSNAQTKTMTVEPGVLSTVNKTGSSAVVKAMTSELNVSL